jgi:hypothetical protein
MLLFLGDRGGVRGGLVPDRYPRRGVGMMPITGLDSSSDEMGNSRQMR